MNEIEQTLEQANRCGNETWRLWHYRAETGILTLCGYQPKFDVTGYLRFYSPSYVRLLQWLENARFTLGTAGDEGMPDGHLVPSDSYVVLIRTSETTFCIVCKEVVFTREMP